MYTIKRLSSSQSNLVLSHLNRLDPQSTYERFCVAATSEFISRYVSQINFERSGIYGVFDNQLALIGLGECVFYADKTDEAEVAFSIELSHQGKGLGNRLMKRLIQFSKAHDIKSLHMYCLRTNSKSLHIAKKYGLNLSYDKGDVSTQIKLPSTPGYLHKNFELVEDIVANFEIVHKNNSKLWKINKDLMKVIFKKNES